MVNNISLCSMGKQFPLTLGTDLHILFYFFSDEELDNLPHVIMTCDTIWSPSRYDSPPSFGDTYGFTTTASWSHPTPPRLQPLRGAYRCQTRLPSLLSLLCRTGPTLGDFNVLDILQGKSLAINMGEGTSVPINHAEHQRFFLNRLAVVIRHTSNSTNTRFDIRVGGVLLHSTRSSRAPEGQCLERLLCMLMLPLALGIILHSITWWGQVTCTCFHPSLNRVCIE